MRPTRQVRASPIKRRSHFNELNEIYTNLKCQIRMTDAVTHNCSQDRKQTHKGVVRDGSRNFQLHNPGVMLQQNSPTHVLPRLSILLRHLIVFRPGYAISCVNH
ncbi:hypothetical protein CEXT_259721 [Caerostris extrusa]|uniref:Uncharacterized protein n=1 Tax=Caerostris extrusa TaxID=172846 RepID=A0AAV4M3N5_CAEEX|nr:hypothetical protein CEXT_259721 [Caerostris extrusa]